MIRDLTNLIEKLVEYRCASDAGWVGPSRHVAALIVEKGQCFEGGYHWNQPCRNSLLGERTTPNLIGVACRKISSC